jgi:hypothetical protein
MVALARNQHPLLKTLDPRDLLRDLASIERQVPGALAVVTWSLLPDQHAALRRLLQETDEAPPKPVEQLIAGGAQWI